MILNYDEYEILNREKGYFNKRPFIGYISPKGDLVDFSSLIGPQGHDNWRNPITPCFISFISFVVIGEKIDNLKNSEFDIRRKLYLFNQYDGFDDIVRRGLSYYDDFNKDDYDSFLNRLKNIIRKQEESRHEWAELCSKYNFEYRSDDSYWNELEFELMHFFEKCYSKRDFFYSLGKVIKIHNDITFFNKYKNLLGDDYHTKREFYYNYCIVALMSYFKDIMVQYLGYDSIERAFPECDLNIINNLYDNSNGYVFSNNPRTITTSCTNPNERFYNWLLMDWSIKRIPKMLWNEVEKRYIQEDSIMNYYQTDQEMILGKEIESIKREIPKKYRKEYFRK